MGWGMVRSSIHILGVPATRSNPRKTSPLENEWDLLEDGKKPRLHKGMCTDLVIHSQCGCEKLKTAWGSLACFPGPPYHTPSTPGCQGECVQLKKMKLAWAPALPLTRPEAAIASVCISEYTWEGVKPAQ